MLRLFCYIFYFLYQLSLSGCTETGIVVQLEFKSTFILWQCDCKHWENKPNVLQSLRTFFILSPTDPTKLAVVAKQPWEFQMWPPSCWEIHELHRNTFWEFLNSFSREFFIDDRFWPALRIFPIIYTWNGKLKISTNSLLHFDRFQSTPFVYESAVLAHSHTWSSD